MTYLPIALVTTFLVWSLRQIYKSVMAAVGYTDDYPDNFDYAHNRRKELAQLDAVNLLKTPSNIRVEQGYHENSEGHLLFWRCFIPTDVERPSSMLCFCNGYNGHCEWLDYDINLEFAKRGYVMFVYDHMGHGRSYGKWMSIPDFEILVDDAICIFEFAKKKFGRPDMNYFLAGSSMGGAVALQVSRKQDYRNIMQSSVLSNGGVPQNYLQRWNGCLLAAPMVGIQEENGTNRRWLLAFATILAKIVPDAPWGPLRDLRDFTCKDPKIIKHIKAKPVTWNKKIRLGTALQLLQQCQILQAQLEDIHIPLLIMHGKQDKVTCYEMSVKCYEKAGSKDKELKIYNNAWHWLLVDEWKTQVFDDMDAWMQQRQGHIYRASQYQMLSLEEKKHLQKKSQHRKRHFHRLNE